MKLLQYLCIPFLLVVTGCAGCEDDPLSFSKTEYTGNQLRIDGYYYTEYFNTEKYYQVYFLYKNGVVLYGDAFEANRIAEKENQWQTEQWQNAAKGAKYYWGIFKVENDTIEIEKWYPGDKPYSAYVNKGIVLNDTTFIINEQYKLSGGTKSDSVTRDKVYHFKQFSPKPDSTNPYVVRF